MDWGLKNCKILQTSSNDKLCVMWTGGYGYSLMMLAYLFIFLLP